MDIHFIAVHVLQLQWPSSLNEWKEGNNIPVDRLHWASSVLINGNMYFGGNDQESDIVIKYNPVNGNWSELPRAPVKAFAMTSFNNQLVLIGGDSADSIDVDSIMVWDCNGCKWIKYDHSLPTGRSQSAAVCYENQYLIVACGFLCKRDVDVLDIANGKCYKAQSVPQGGHSISSVVVGDRWYLSSGHWKDCEPHIYYTHLSTLKHTAKSDGPTTESIWHELPRPPVALPTLLSLQEHLFLAGGAMENDRYMQEIYCYDQKSGKWELCGKLPVAMFGASCAVLPSREMIVAGGKTKNDIESKRVWIASTLSNI